MADLLSNRSNDLMISLECKKSRWLVWMSSKRSLFAHFQSNWFLFFRGGHWNLEAHGALYYQRKKGTYCQAHHRKRQGRPISIPTFLKHFMHVNWFCLESTYYYYLGIGWVRGKTSQSECSFLSCAVKRNKEKYTNQ